MQAEMQSYFLSSTFCANYSQDQAIDYCNSYLAVNEQKLNINGIVKLNEILDWFYQIYLPVLENSKLLNKSLDGNLKQIHSSFDIMGGYSSRVTFRYYTVKSESIILNSPAVKIK